MIVDQFGFPIITNYSVIRSFAETADNLERQERYNENWAFYLGNQAGPEAPSLKDKPYDFRRKEIRKINYIKKLVDIHANFLMKQGFDITIPDLPETPENESQSRTFIKELLDNTWRKNNKKELSFKMAQQGGITGDVFLYFSWKENDPVYKKPYVKIDLIPSQYCYPVLGGPDGRDRLDVRAVIVIFPVYIENKNIDARFSNLRDSPSYYTVNQPANVTNRTVSTQYEAEIWTNTQKIKLSSYNNIITTEKNPFGEIPVVHIANLPVAGDYFGLSDISDAIDVQKEFNFKNRDISRIIKFHSSPRIIAKNIDKDSSDFDASPESIWFVKNSSDLDKAQSEITTLEMKGDLKAAQEQLTNLRKYLFELTDTPSNALGQAEGGSNAESAAAQSVRYMPMLDKRLLKVGTYGDGIVAANRIILKIEEIMTSDSEFQNKINDLPEETRYLTSITFPNPFPRDEDLELSRYDKKLKLGLITKEGVLREMGHGEQDAKTIIEAREKEMARELALGLSQVKTPSGNPNPVRENGNVQGERHSTTTEKESVK